MAYDSFVEELKDKVNIKDIVSQQTSLHKKGDSYWGLCPFHGEKTASFSVCPNKGFYYCFGCGAHGDIFAFVMGTMNMDFKEAIQYIADFAHIPVPSNKTIEQLERDNAVFELLDTATCIYQDELYKDSGANALRYLEKRGFTNEIIKKYRIGFAPNYNRITPIVGACRSDVCKSSSLIGESNGKPYEFFRNRIMFPIMNKHGKVIAFSGRSIDDAEPKYLNSNSTGVFHKKNSLFGINFATDAVYKKHRIIVVEGQIDVIKMQCNGFEETVAPLGCAITDDHLKMLNHISKNMIFCFDGDNAGKRASQRVLQMLLPMMTIEHTGVKFVFLPDGKDPDDVLTESKSTMENLISNAITWHEYLWHAIETRYDNRDQMNRARTRALICDSTQLIEDEQLRIGLREQFLARYYKRFFPKKIIKEMLV